MENPQRTSITEEELIHINKNKRGRKKQIFTMDLGISQEPIEKYVRFGQIVINKQMLFESRKLSLRYFPSLASIKNTPSRYVSQDFVNLLKGIWEGNKLDYKLLNGLSEDEKDFFHIILRKAKLDHQLGVYGLRSEETEKELKRFELLKGQVLAGNNAKEVLRELKQLIIKFMNNGTISKTEGANILTELIGIL